jgi:hypothetical protein
MRSRRGLRAALAITLGLPSAAAWHGTALAEVPPSATELAAYTGPHAAAAQGDLEALAIGPPMLEAATLKR